MTDTAKFLAALGVPTPWRLDEESPGSLLHAGAGSVLVVDQHNELSDEQASEIAVLVMDAVNQMAGAV